MQRGYRESGRPLARKMAFAQSAILWGSLSCDQPAFATAHHGRIGALQPVPRVFLFLGRFVRGKGLGTLVRAYQIYRNKTRDPWPLICCGAGPLRDQLEDKPGITVEDFVQPDQMPARLATAGCLVLPSDFEHWSLVVHEAASSGLLILASQPVGATVHFVQPDYNEYIFGKRDADGLASLMMRVSRMSDGRLDAMSRASHLLSEQIRPRDGLTRYSTPSLLRSSISHLLSQLGIPRPASSRTENHRNPTTSAVAGKRPACLANEKPDHCPRNTREINFPANC